MVRFDRVATRLSLALSMGLLTMGLVTMFSQAMFFPEARAQDFVRGNANADASVDLSDVVFSLEYLYLGGPAPSCLDAADTNDDGALDVADPVLSLFQQFHGAEVPGPRPDCGEDPTEDNLTCLKLGQIRCDRRCVGRQSKKRDHRGRGQPHPQTRFSHHRSTSVVTDFDLP